MKNIQLMRDIELLEEKIRTYIKKDRSADYPIVRQYLEQSGTGIPDGVPAEEKTYTIPNLPFLVDPVWGRIVEAKPADIEGIEPFEMDVEGKLTPLYLFVKVSNTGKSAIMHETHGFLEPYAKFALKAVEAQYNERNWGKK